MHAKKFKFSCKTEHNGFFVQFKLDYCEQYCQIILFFSLSNKNCRIIKKINEHTKGRKQTEIKLIHSPFTVKNEFMLHIKHNFSY
jgi:hypothetical protein